MTAADPRRIKALLLAAGLGTRLRPLTDTVPKCLIQIGDRPLLGYWFELMQGTSVRDVLINTHHLRDQVAEYLERVNRENRFHVTESYERELLGSAGTIRANALWMDDADDCLVIYTDNLSDVDLGQLIRFHESHGDPFTMMLFRTPYPSQCGIATLDRDSRIIDFVEKPSSPVSDLANAGVYILTKTAYQEIAERNAFDLGHDVLPSFVGRMRGWLHEGYHRDIGTAESLRLARHDVLSLDVTGR